MSGAGQKRKLGPAILTPFFPQEETHAPQHLHLYSIIRSARSRNDSGMVRPSAFAVLRLIVSLNLVGNTTGRSPGFSPFRIRPTSIPACRYTSIGSAP